MTPEYEHPVFDAVVVGGGIVGLATAAALREASAGTLRIALADPKLTETPRADGRALALSAASRHLLEAIGAWDALAPQAEAMRSIAISDADLSDVLRPLLLGFPEESLGGEIFAHVAPTEAIVAALRERVEQTGVVLHPHALVGRESAPGVTRLLWSDGTQSLARLLIAADGKDSAVRAAAGIQVFRWSYGQHALVTTVALPEPHGGRAVQFFLPGGPFALLPLPGQRASVVWSERSAEALRIAALPDDAFMEELSRRAGPEIGPLTLAGPRGCFPLSGMIARSFTAERLALAGDAARVLHPIAGQGVNVGLRDTAALVELVVSAARLGQDVGAQDLLAAYERWRRFDSAAFLAVTDGLTRLFRLDGAVIRSIRDAGFGVVDRLPAAKRRIVQAAAGLAGAKPKLLDGLMP